MIKRVAQVLVKVNEDWRLVNIKAPDDGPVVDWSHVLLQDLTPSETLKLRNSISRKWVERRHEDSDWFAAEEDLSDPDDDETPFEYWTKPLDVELNYTALCFIAEAHPDRLINLEDLLEINGLPRESLSCLKEDELQDLMTWLAHRKADTAVTDTDVANYLSRGLFEWLMTLLFDFCGDVANLVRWVQVRRVVIGD